MNFRSAMDITLNNTTLENVSVQKDLGVTMSSNLYWVNHVDVRISKARMSFFLLKDNIPWITPSRTKYKLYECMVLSVLIYRCAMYTPSIAASKRMESFQKV